MRLLAGLLLPDEGTVTVCGFDTRTRARRRSAGSVSYMPQRFGLYEDLTVQREPQPLRRPARRHRRRSAQQAFERLLAFTAWRRSPAGWPASSPAG